jgi:hypothetical protein
VRIKLTYANVISTLALFLVLSGGAAYGASQLGKNSVGTKQLKNGAVTQAKISTGAQQALKGERGEAGPRGAAGATSVVVRHSAPVSVAPGGVVQEEAQCSPGERAVGGGMSWQEVATSDMRVLETLPAGPTGSVPTAWGATGSNDTAGTKHFIVSVICASP